MKPNEKEALRILRRIAKSGAYGIVFSVVIDHATKARASGSLTKLVWEDLEELLALDLDWEPRSDSK